MALPSSISSVTMGQALAPSTRRALVTRPCVSGLPLRSMVMRYSVAASTREARSSRSSVRICATRLSPRLCSSCHARRSGPAEPANAIARMWHGRVPDARAAEFIVISYWRSLDEIKAYAGADIEKTHNLPRDSEFLL